ncbi:MAG TPA: VOC family protein [Steroidobacteraceae bacterium]|nr:VOC family protein [Steroidobacteraceae bacterium]
MTNRYLFHLSIPVAELGPAKRFYMEVLGASAGRASAEWLDVIIWGHQLTLQHRPAETRALEEQGKRHFGVVLPWSEWEQEVRRLRELGVVFLGEPAVMQEGTEEEQAKFYLNDPSNNVIEIKTYRHPEHTLMLDAVGAFARSR